MNMFKISIVSFVLVLSSCGMQKLTPSGISTVKINTNINPTEINDNNKITVKNLKGESRSFKTPTFSYNSFDDYNFTKNQFSKKRRTLIVSHPNYNPDTIVVRRKLRPVVFSLDILGAITLYLSPSLIIDLANGNIWKVKKSDKKKEVNLFPKIDIFQRNVDTLFTSINKIGTTNFEPIVNAAYSIMIKYNEEPYISMIRPVFDSAFTKQINFLVENMDYSKIKNLDKKFPKLNTKYGKILNDALLNCKKRIEDNISKKSGLIFESIDKNKFEKMSHEELMVLNMIIDYKRDFGEYQIHPKILNNNSKIINAYINGSFYELENFKDSTREQFVNEYNFYDKKIRTLCNQLTLNYNDIKNSTLKIDSVYNFLIGFKSFCKNKNNSLSGRFELEIRKNLDNYLGGEVYNSNTNGLLNKQYANNPKSYLYQTQFSNDSTRVTYTFLNHTFKNEKQICVVKFDFPDERGTYTERNKKGEIEVFNVKRDNIYFKYYQVDTILNESYYNNLDIARDNAQKTKKILQSSGNNPVETYLKINQSSEITGSLYKRKLSFTSITGKYNKDRNIENLVYYDKNYNLPVISSDKLQSWDIMVNELSYGIKDVLDYGKGYMYYEELFENLFKKNKCSPDSGGLFDQ